MCNPLLDISAVVPAELLTKYNVKVRNHRTFPLCPHSSFRRG